MVLIGRGDPCACEPLRTRLNRQYWLGSVSKGKGDWRTLVSP